MVSLVTGAYRGAFTLLTASMFQLLGFLFLLFKCLHTRSLDGISLHSLICYLTVYAVKISMLLVAPAYGWLRAFKRRILPEETRGHHYGYMMTEFLGAAVVIVIMVLISKNLYHDYGADSDAAKSYYMLSVAVLFAIAFHPKHASHFIINMIWTFGNYMQTMAILPQLMMMTKRVRRGVIRRREES